jgi:phage baseplate assembly protein W
MRVLSFPFHITLSGTVATTTDYSQVVRGQAIDVLMTNFLERAQRARYGSDISRTVFDPRDSVSQSDLAQQVADRVKDCAPRVLVSSIKISPDPDRNSYLIIDVLYRANPADDAQRLRIPVQSTLSQESQV